ncbi:MAG TPA: PepSY domain-containing protein, partial [Oxalicibacterium sp.]|nr:PepSY domain-containing protein [Oxalicibacterium sp.]
PQMPRGLHSMSLPQVAPMNWQQAFDAARRQAPDTALRMTPPAAKNDVWRVSGADPSRPLQRIDLMLDAYTGKSLFRSDWRDQTAFGKATGVGIPFHRGEFGWWNQLLLLLFGAGILFSLMSGWWMFFKRRKTGASAWPPLLPGAWRSASPAMWIAAVTMCTLMPLLAISGLFVAGVEVLLLRGRTRAAAL